MASRTQWTWIWANSGRWWRAEETGVLPSIESQRVRHNLESEQQQIPWYLGNTSFLSVPPVKFSKQNTHLVPSLGQIPWRPALHIHLRAVWTLVVPLSYFQSSVGDRQAVPTVMTQYHSRGSGKRQGSNVVPSLTRYLGLSWSQYISMP